MGKILNISLDRLDNAKESTANYVSGLVCELPTDSLITWIIIPLLFALFLIFLIRYKDFILDKYYMMFAKRGFVRVWLLLDNKRIKSKLKKLDKDNNFKIGKRRYSLEKLHEFIIGFDKHNFPVFFYDKNFIIPFKVTQENITKEIKEQLSQAQSDKNKDEFDIEEIPDSKISAMYLKIDSTTLNLVYDRKLISDLYSLSTGEGFKKILFFGIIGVVVLIFLYYTGLLEQILTYVGIELTPTTPPK